MLLSWAKTTEKYGAVPRPNSSWGRRALVCLLAFGALVSTSSARADAGFEKVADSSDTAINARANEVLRSGACDDEYFFFLNAETSWTDENQIAEVIAKLGYLIWALNSYPNTSKPACQGTSRVTTSTVFNMFNLALPDDPKAREENKDKISERSPWFFATHDMNSWKFEETNPLKATNVSALNGRMKALYGDACSNVIQTIKPAGDAACPEPLCWNPGNPGVAKDPIYSMTYSVTTDCMRAQVNRALSDMWNFDFEQLGSSAVPCHLFGLTQGEWDVKVRDFVRIMFLDKKNPNLNLLDDATRKRVSDDLISVSGALGPASYELTACGNQEKETGSAQDRIDQQSPSAGDFFSSVGDALGWLAFLLIILVVALSVVAAVGTGVGGVIGAIVAGAGAVGAIALIELLMYGSIPETENHRFMIESSRYLKNQEILKESYDADFAQKQSEVKEFLISRFKRVLSSDFDEYNARPYQRYTIRSLLNLVDFADDQQVKIGAQMALDYDMAKVAVGTYQGRRLVPFRRLMEHLAWIDGRDDAQKYTDPAKYPGFRRVFDFGVAGDSGLLTMLLYTGDVTLFYGHRVGDSGTAELVHVASSSYRPPQFVIDLALNKTTPYLQRIHHGGFEIYSAGPGFLLTAGGIETEPATRLELPTGTGILHPETLLAMQVIPTFRNTDRGGGLPTMLMLGASGPPDLTQGVPPESLAKYIRFEGPSRVEGPNPFDSGTKSLTFDSNLCVWNGFACGYNLVIPPELDGCAVKSGTARGAVWTFIDTKNCGVGYYVPPPAPGTSNDPGSVNNPPRVFVAIFNNSAAPGNPGMLEVVPATDKSDFDSFQKDVMNKNASMDILGVYHTSTGHDLSWQVHQSDSRLDPNDAARVVEVDGVAQQKPQDWRFADGDVISGDGSGIVDIQSPDHSHSLHLDLSDVNNPSRVEH